MPDTFCFDWYIISLLLLHCFCIIYLEMQKKTQNMNTCTATTPLQFWKSIFFLKKNLPIPVENPDSRRESPAESKYAKKSIPTTNGSRDMANLSLPIFRKTRFSDTFSFRTIASGQLAGQIRKANSDTHGWIPLPTIYNIYTLVKLPGRIYVLNRQTDRPILILFIY